MRWKGKLYIHIFYHNKKQKKQKHMYPTWVGSANPTSHEWWNENPGQCGIAVVQEGSEASEQYRLLQLLLTAHRTRREYPNANDTTHKGYRT